MLNPKIASMPLARQLSYIRKTMSKGNLGACQGLGIYLKVKESLTGS